jgi:branched-chain amino acid transport system permease protein
MELLPQLVATGIVNGTVYALVALGVVTIFRVTNVVNFAQGEFVMLGGFLAYTLLAWGLPWLAVAPLVVVALFLGGLLVHRVALQPAGRDASLEALVLITIGVALLLRGVAQVVWGSDPLPVQPFTGSVPIVLAGAAVVPQALWVVGCGAVLACLLYAFFRLTSLGLALRASAEQRTGAHLVGVDTWATGRLSFALGCGIAGLMGVLVTPLSFVSYDIGVLLGLKGFTAAILGGMRSFSGAAMGGLALGLLESGASGYISSGYRDAVTFVVLAAVLLVRPASLSRGGTETDLDALAGQTATASRFDRVRTSAHRWAVGGLIVVVLGLSFVLPAPLLSALVFAGLFSLVAVGVVLLLGYAGQISFGHASFLGIGAYATGLLTVRLGLPPLLALVVGAVLAAAIAWIVGAVIFRLRGFYLAMLTLGLTIIFTVVVTQLRTITGGANGIPGILPFEILGVRVADDRAYFLLAWGLVAAALLLGFNLIDSRFGRATRAIKGSEMAALAAGVDTGQVKLQILVLSAVMASVAGSLYAHYLTLVYPHVLDVSQALAILIMAIVGGTATLWGAPVGAVFMTLLPELMQRAMPDAAAADRAAQFQQILFGLLLIVVMIARPDGLTGLLGGWLGRRRPPAPTATASAQPQSRPPLAVNPRSSELLPAPNALDGVTGSALNVAGLSKSFGGLHAAKNVWLDVPTGSIAALIGPNGAGKTTVFNCIAGVLRSDQGTIRLGVRELNHPAPYRLAELGLARTFQNVRLFGNMTVLENVMVGCHARTRATLLEALFRVGRHRSEERRIQAEAAHWLAYVGLGDLADRNAFSLAFGQQRLLEVARALAARPRVLLLDEPAAGLNPVEKEGLARLLLDIRAHGTTLLLVEHDMRLVMQVADHIVVLDHGEVIARGTPAAVRADPRVVEAYLGAPL